MQIIFQKKVQKPQYGKTWITLKVFGLVKKWTVKSYIYEFVNFRKKKIEKFLNLKFWQFLKEKNVKLQKTLKLALVNFEGCPCKIVKTFNLDFF